MYVNTKYESSVERGEKTEWEISVTKYVELPEMAELYCTTLADDRGKQFKFYIKFFLNEIFVNYNFLYKFLTIVPIQLFEDYMKDFKNFKKWNLSNDVNSYDYSNLETFQEIALVRQIFVQQVEI